MIDPWCFAFYFSHLPSTLCRTSPPVPSLNWCHVLRCARCRLAALLAHRPAVSAQPQGSLADVIYATLLCWCEDGASWRQRSSARVLLREAAPPRLPSLSTPDCATLGPHLQPGIVFKKSTMESKSVPKQSEVVSPAASVPQTFHYWKMSLVPYVDGEIFCFISGVGFVRNPSADCSNSAKQIRCLTECVCACVCLWFAGLQSNLMTTEKTSGMKSTMEGDARRTNQVGALWNSQQPEIIWPGGLPALWRARQLSLSVPTTQDTPTALFWVFHSHLRT